MHLTSTVGSLLLLCLACLIKPPPPAVGQFWRKSVEDQWLSETLATRPSGICYDEKEVMAINPDSRRRQFSYCCNGYLNEGTSRNLKCVPICEEDCTNGLCYSPGRCECAPGYTWRDRKCRIM